MVIAEFIFSGERIKISYNPRDSSGRGSIREIIRNNEYLLDKFKNLSGKVLIDIGANVGVATVIMAKLNPKSIVYSFEPLKEVYDYVVENIKLNNLTNVVAFNQAVTKEGIDKLKLSTLPNMTGASTLYADNSDFVKNYKINNNNVVMVDCTSFDKFIDKYKIDSVELFKIDCEGAEYDIIYGSKHFKNGVVKNMVGEFHNLKNLSKKKGYNGADLIMYSKKHVGGLVHMSVLNLTQKY